MSFTKGLTSNLSKCSGARSFTPKVVRASQKTVMASKRYSTKRSARPSLGIKMMQSIQTMAGTAGISVRKPSFFGFFRGLMPIDKFAKININ